MCVCVCVWGGVPEVLQRAIDAAQEAHTQEREKNKKSSNPIRMDAGYKCPLCSCF